MKEFKLPPFGRRETFVVALEMLLERAHPRILEIGTIWNEDFHGGVMGDGWSTLMLAYAAGVRDGKLTSVDINPRAVNSCQRLLDAHGLSGPHVEVIEAEAVGFCSNFSEELDMLYLDGGGPPTATSAMSPGVAEHHWDLFAPLENFVKPGGLVMLDDQHFFEPDWAGKGRIVIPYLLKKGWKTIVKGYAFLLQRPI